MLERFRSGVKLKSLFLQSGDNNQSGDRRFPMSEGEVDVPFILTRRLARVQLPLPAVGPVLIPTFSWSVSLSENRSPLFQDTLYANQRLRRL